MVPEPMQNSAQAQGAKLRQRIKFVVRSRVHEGLLLKLAPDGVLLASSVEFPNGTSILLRFTPPGESTVELSLVLTKAGKLKDQLDGFDHGIGAKFSKPSEDLTKQIESWVKAYVKEPEPQMVRTPAPVAPGTRESPRTEVKAKLCISVEKQPPEDGELMNLSQSGILFAARSEISVGTPVRVFVEPPNTEHHLELTAAVVRVASLREPRGSFTFAVGAKFSNLSDVEKEKLKFWISQLFASKAKVPPPPPEFVRKVLQAGPELITPMIGQDSVDQQFRFLDELDDFEKGAFSKQDKQSESVQSLVMLGVQFGVFTDFVPMIAKQPNTFAEPFLAFLPPLFEKSEAVEGEMDEHVRVAVSEGREEDRQKLNQASNWLHENKTKMMFVLVETIGGNITVSQMPVFQDIQRKVEEVRSLQQNTAEAIRYNRRPPEPSPKKEEKKKTGPSFFSTWKFKAAAGLLVVVIGGGMAWKFFSSRISSDELGIPLAVQKVVLEEEGIIVHSRGVDWDRLQEAERDLTFSKLEEYLRPRFLYQAKILDERGRTMAALASGPFGKKRLYTRRVFRR